MPKPTIKALQAQIDTLRELRAGDVRYKDEAEWLRQQLARSERRFDQLLEGMCWGMREANLPRRPA